MPQTEVNQFDEVPNNNTDIDGTTVKQGEMYPFHVDDGFRKLMAALKRTFRADLFRLRDSTDQTKLAAFDLSAITPATTRTVGIPNKSGTLAMADDIMTSATTAKMDSRPSLIVNGNFQMSQENGTTLSTANNFYFADQFFLSFAASTAAMSVQLLTSVRTLSGNDRVGELKTTTAKASLAGTDFVTLSTVIEGSRPEWKAAAFGTAGAKPFVYRFEFTGPAGLYHMHFQNSAGNRHCAVPFTVAAPEANVATVRTLVLPADTTGTWLFGDGDKGLVCDLVLAAGATLTGGTASTWGATARLAATTQFNILSSTSNVARIADVGLKNDPDATGVYGLFRVNDVDPIYQSLRYWRAIGYQGDMTGYAPNATSINVAASIGPAMAKGPSATLATTTPSFLTRDGASANGVGSAISSQGSTPTSFRALINGFSSLGTTYNMVISANGSNPIFNLNSRL